MKEKVCVTWASSGFWKMLVEKLHETSLFDVTAAFQLEKHYDVYKNYQTVGIQSLDFYLDMKQDYSDISKKMSNFDVLICNAWRIWYGKTSDFSLQQMRTFFEVNCIWHMNIISEIYRNRKKSGNKSKMKIIFISSVAWDVYIPNIALYSASKSALNMLIRHMQRDHSDIFDIYSISPGPYETNLDRNTMIPDFAEKTFPIPLDPNENIEDMFRLVYSILKHETKENFFVLDSTYFFKIINAIQKYKNSFDDYLISLYQKNIWK